MPLAPWDDPRAVWVCEEHPDRPWESGNPEDCQCGAPGMPLLHGQPYPDPPLMVMCDGVAGLPPGVEPDEAWAA